MLSRDVEPSFGLDVLLALPLLVQGQLIQLVILDDLGDELRLFLDVVRHWQFLELLQDGDH